MSIAEGVSLAALLISVIYHWANRRDVLTRIEEWRKSVDKEMEELKTDFKKSQYAELEQRLTHAEEFITELRHVKHTVTDKYLPNRFEALEFRVQQIDVKKNE